jgi:hypothetical protein
MLTLKHSQLLPEMTINAACPGLTATDFAAGLSGAEPVLERTVEVILDLATVAPVGRWGPSSNAPVHSPGTTP